MRSKRGFTLIEVLIVIAILGVLISLILPAMAAARESGRRTMCENQMRQIMLAMQQYELSQVHFPAGTSDSKGPVRNLNVGYHHGWTLALLPYMEQEPLSRHVDTSVSIYAPANEPLRAFRLNGWLCPSESAHRDWKGSSYAACHSSTETPIDAENDGTFILNKVFKRNDIRDGLTYTVFLGEKIVDPWDRGWYSGTRSTLRNTGCELVRNRSKYHRIDKPWANMAATQGENPGAPKPPAGSTVPPSASPGAPPVFPIPGSPTFNPIDTSQFIPAFSTDDAESVSSSAPLPSVLNGGPPRDNDDVGGFGSMHQGSVAFVFGDGSIRRVSLMVDRGVLARYGSRNDGGFPPELPQP